MKNKFLDFFNSPTDILFHLYNLLVCLFVIIFHDQIHIAYTLILSHLIIAFGYYYIKKITAENNSHSYISIIFTIMTLSFLHYESGMLNLIIFPEYFDDIVRSLDIHLFGLAPYKIADNYLNHPFIVQFFHFFYFSYYLILFIPILLILKKETYYNSIPSGSTERSFFLLLFSMFACYIIFIIFPVKGPTDIHFEIFNKYNSLVGFLDFIYKYGDTHGGAMPSSHVAVSLVITVQSYHYLKKLFPYILCTFIFLTISTVYCSFHYGVDAIAGLVGGLIFYYLGESLYNFTQERLGGE